MSTTLFTPIDPKCILYQKDINPSAMEALERLNMRIEYGRKVDNEPSKMFFSLEPTLRFALANYLERKHREEVADEPLYYMGDLELIGLFDKLVDMDQTTNNQIYELYQAITDFRLITFSMRHGNNSETILSKKQNLKDTNYYLGLMENVVHTLLSRVNACC